MKSLLKLFAFTSALVLIAISCQKVLSNESSSSATSSKEFNTTFVKNWYVQTFVKTADWQNVWAKEKNVVDWKNDNYHKVGTMEVIEYPLQKQKTSLLIIHKSLTNDQIKKLVNASLKRVAFIKNTKNEISVRELDYIPDWEYLQKKQFDIGNIYYDKPGSDFTGNLVVKSWNGTILSMFKIDNGAIAKKYSFNAASGTAQRRCPGDEACMWYEDCDFYGDGFYTNCGEPYMDPTDCIDTGNGCDPMGGGDPCQIYGNCNESGGGGAGSSPCTQCDPTLISPQEEEFNNYVQMASSSPITNNSPTSVAGPDPISGVTIWTVAEGALANWSVKANTEYKYYHYRVFNTNAFVHEYDLFYYKTVSTYYTGSNSFITSTWNSTSVTDQVINNNTSNTEGKSRVIGTIRHVANYEMKCPFCPKVLDVTDDADKSMTLQPR